MASADELKLRSLLGEEIPEGGSEDETLFTDEKIAELLASNSELERAAYEGWRIKAAKLSSLVDTTEGNAQRKFGQLLDNALDMVKIYQRSSSGPTEGRTRIGHIKREAPGSW